MKYLSILFFAILSFSADAHARRPVCNYGAGQTLLVGAVAGSVLIGEDCNNIIGVGTICTCTYRKTQWFGCQSGGSIVSWGSYSFYLMSTSLEGSCSESQPKSVHDVAHDEMNFLEELEKIEDGTCGETRGAQRNLATKK